VQGHWVVDVILFAALLSLSKVFNGNFVAATRLLFALGRRKLIDARMARVHEVNQTPSVAVLSLGILTAAALFLGDSILIPITEVGSMASAFGWLAACASYFAMEENHRERVVSSVGILVASLLIAMKVFPFVPGHFTWHEWIALAVWIVMGIALRRGG
jgi:APA family basic amino acid/polyamine antiporter